MLPRWARFLRRLKAYWHPHPPLPNDSAFLRLAKGPKADPHTLRIIAQLKDSAASWDQDADDLSDEEAFRILLEKKWINSQGNWNDGEPPLTDITVLSDFPQLTGLCLWHNEISSLEPLAGLTKLETLGLTGNSIEDLAPLRGMTALKELDVQENPVRDLSVLAQLPALEKLEASCDQFTEATAALTLPAVRKLRLHGTLADFQSFPAFPNLRVLIAQCDCASLTGIERFTELRNLAVSGTIDDLSPLSGLRKLTHLNIGHNRVTSLAPLSELFALREVWAGYNQISSVAPLARLPVLHAVNLKENPLPESEARELETYLTPWSDEFADPHPHTQPALAIKVVSQEVWDYFDTHRFNIAADDDGDEGMLESEKSWLSDQIEEALCRDWKKEEDFEIPWKSPRSRSFTICLYSEEAGAELRSIATTIQRALCAARNEYIVNLQTDFIGKDTPQYVVWVYRDHLLVAAEDESTITKLLAR